MSELHTLHQSKEFQGLRGHDLGLCLFQLYFELTGFCSQCIMGTQVGSAEHFQFHDYIHVDVSSKWSLTLRLPFFMCCWFEGLSTAALIMTLNQL